MTDDNASDDDGLFSDILSEDNLNDEAAASDEPAKGDSIDSEAVGTAEFSDVEYLNFGTFTYHLRRDDAPETVCGLSIADREFKSSSRKPDLLDPCKQCHGKGSRESNEEQRRQLRAAIAEHVDTVALNEASPGEFSKSELLAITKALPTDFPTFRPTPTTLRLQLSRAIVGVNNSQSEPTQFDKKELNALNEAFARTDVVPREPAVVILTEDGRIRRTACSAFQSQRRGGKGTNRIYLPQDDEINAIYSYYPRNQLYCLTTAGQIYEFHGHELPVGSLDDPGITVQDTLPIQDDEAVAALLNAPDIGDYEFLVTATADGKLKRTGTDQFENILSTGIIAVDLFESSLIDARWSDGESDLLITTAAGQSIRFGEDEARPMTRQAKGVGGIKLDSTDQAVSLSVLPNDFDGEILSLTQNGYGKRTPVDEYQKQNRYGKGLVDINTGDRNGPVVTARPITSDEDIIIVTRQGRSIRVAASEISTVGRNTMGVNIIDLDSKDTVAGATIVPRS